MPRRSRYKPSERYGGKEIGELVYSKSYTIDELQSLRRTLAKRANQRIVRLERATSKITGEKFSEFGAITDAYQYLNLQQEGRKRFSEKKDALTDINALRREVTVLQGFLGRKSSLVSGMREIEKKRIETFESGKWGKASRFGGGTRRELKFASTKEFYDFLNSSIFKGLVKSGFTSEQVLETYDIAVDKYEGQQDEVIDQMAEALAAYRSGEKATLKDFKTRLGMQKIT